MVHKVVKSGICLGFGGLAVVAGLVMLLGWPVYFMKHYKEIMILKPTSVAYNIWQDPKTPSYIEFFMFNISNIDELLVNSSDHYKLKPIIKEFGPYVYREDIVKTNITWHDNSTISFINDRKLSFQQSMSKGKLSDLVTSVNPFLATLIYKHRWFSPIYYIYYESEVQKRIDRQRWIDGAIQRNKERRERLLAQGKLYPAWQEYVPDPLPKVTDSYEDFRKEIEKEHKNMYTTATVSEWLFDGIRYPLFKKLPNTKFVWSSAWNFSKEWLTGPFETFGWYFNRTEPKYEGTYLMNTGKRNFLEIGKIHQWRNSDRTVYNARCGRVRGDEIWGPFWGQPRTIPIFNSDICTYLVFHKAVNRKKLGFKVVEYQLPENTFNNRDKDSWDKCYCSSNSPHASENCLPRGALNITDCRGVLDDIGVHVIPLFASQPYFRGGDRIFRDRLTGMRNQWWRTKSFFGLETFTGTTLYTRMTLQFNIMVTTIRGAQIGMNLPRNNTVIPMFWYRRTSSIADDNVEMIKLVHRLRFGLPYAFYALILLGLILIACGLLILSKGLIRFIQKLMKTKKACCQLCRDITRKMRR